MSAAPTYHQLTNNDPDPLDAYPLQMDNDYNMIDSCKSSFICVIP